jgi:phospholipase/carboxylesterase
MRSITTKLGNLPCQVVQAAEGPPELAVLLCHGFGAPGTDLVPLAAELVELEPDRLKKVRFVFPQAPLSLAAYGYGDARAWWLIDMQRMTALQTGDAAALQKMRAETPEGLVPARRELMAALEALSKSTGLPYSRIVLGGFSQGAMLATDLALRLEEAPAALVLLSGTIICEPEWEKRAPIRKGLKVLQSHGRQDPILGFRAAEALRDLLTRAGLSVDFIPFDGGHTIGMEAMTRLAKLLGGLAPKK